MPDHLSTKDWKAVLKKHPAIKKTGLSEVMDGYEAAEKKADKGKTMSALVKLLDKAAEVKTAHAKVKDIADFLTGTIKAAKVRQQELAKEIEAAETEEDGSGGTLAKDLVKVKAMKDLDHAWNFVLVPGKPSPGFVITKKTIGKAHMTQAFEMRGKRAVFFTGKIHHNGTQYVLTLEAKPPAGLAKAAKAAALLHAEMTIKVLVQGGGVELSDEDDIEIREEGEAPTGSAPVIDADRKTDYAARLTTINDALKAYELLPAPRPEATVDYLRGLIRNLSGVIAGDAGLSKDQAGKLEGRLDTFRARLTLASTPPKVAPSSKYPDLASWKTLAERIIRLDVEKRKDAWLKFTAQIDKTRETVTADKTLPKAEADKVKKILDEAAAIALRNWGYSDKMARLDEAGETPEIAKLLTEMERRYEVLKDFPGLDPKQRDVEKTFVTLRQAFRAGGLADKKPDLMRLKALRDELERIARLGYAARQQKSQREGRDRIAETMKTGLAFMKQAMVPSGLIKDPEAIRKAAKDTPEVTVLIQAMGKGTKTPGKDAGVEMEKAAREVLAKVEDDGEVAILAKQVLARGAMMRLVEDYEGLGDPSTWDQAKTDRASELQAQLFFLEGSVLSGGAKYVVPSTGSDGGASGSWWIERQEVGVEGTDADYTIKGKKSYIFKPGQREGRAFGGLPPGMGAPREVMAKKLDEVLAGAGFSVGVSPTTLARIDTSQLQMREKSRGFKGEQIGSMQQLAATDGTLADHMGDFGAFAKNVDKKSFDDVVVFDMLFANLDRHSKNMMFRTDPETGKHKMVPIDHGSSLPDPLVLQANRVSLTSEVNVLANRDFPPANEPLGPEAIEGLARLDPDQMVRDMKTARDEMALAHPETDGTLSDEAIEALGARTRFTRLAAEEGIPIAMIFEMLAIGALDIARARPDAMPALVKSLLKEAKEQLKGKEEVGAIKDLFRDDKGNSTPYPLMTSLQELGWGATLTGAGLSDWIAENPKLVARIMRTRAPNPAIQQEINRLLPLARANNPDIDKEIAPKEVAAQYELLYKAVHADVMGKVDRTAKASDLKRSFTALGGRAVAERGAKTFPSAFFNWLDRPEPKNEKEQQKYYADILPKLQQFLRFEQLGGLPELMAQGGSVTREMTVDTAVLRLEELKMTAAARKTLLDKTEEEIDEEADAVTEATLAEVTRLVRTLRSKDHKDTVQDLLDKAEEAAEGEDPLQVTAYAYRARDRVMTFLESEADFKKIAEEEKQKIRTEFAALTDDQKADAQDLQDECLDSLDRSVLGHDHAMRNKAAGRWTYELEAILQGDEAAIVKAAKEFEVLKKRVDALAGGPWDDGLTNWADQVTRELAAFAINSVEEKLAKLARSLDAAEALTKAIGDADLTDAPQAVKDLIAKWQSVISSSHETEKFPEGVAAFRALLSEPVEE